MTHKVLMATMGLHIGGAETHIVELAKQLKAQGHDVAVVSNGGAFVPEILAAGIRHYDAPLHQRSISCMLQSLRILRRVIRQERPDVVHAHARIPGFLCGLLKKTMRFPFVTTCHGVYAASGALKLLSDWGQRSLAVSEDVRDYLMHQYHIPAENIALTINGIDTEKFSPAVSAEPIRQEFDLGDATVIGHVSRLDAASSLAARQLIELAPALDQAVPGVRILITGSGDVYNELLARAEQVNAAMGRNCLILTGARTDINHLVAACDLFVGVSRAALEAMAACKPVILSGAQGHTGLFTPDLLQKAMETNFCCRTDPVTTQEGLLSDITAALALSPVQLAALGQHGRQVIWDHFSVERMARDSLDMYEQVIPPRQVLMSGYYGFSNAGDDAILQSIRDSLTMDGENIALTVLSNNPEQTSNRYSLKAVPRFNLPALWRALGRCDVLLSGGGSLLQDHTSTRSLLYYLSVMSLARLRGKKVMLYANGIGPVTRPANRRRVKHAVNKADVITLRDNNSRLELEAMGVTRPDLHVTADPVFSMQWAEDGRVDEILQTAGLSPDQPFTVISVRSWSGMNDFPAQLAKVCDHLHRVHGQTCVFVLMQPHRDRDISRQIMAQMQTPALLLDQPLTPGEIMGVIARSRLCLAMRLHTLIFAARTCVPLAGLVYDPKVSSYLAELDMPCAGNVTSFDGDSAIRTLDALMADYDARKAALTRRSEQLTQAATENRRLLLELLETK